MKSGVLAVIIGRAGSKGLPGKNSRMLCNRPLVCHTIDDARAARRVSRTVVSTDGPAIAAAARAMNVEVVDRPAHLATDQAPVDATVRHAVRTIEGGNGVSDVIVILYANVPVRPDGLIDRAIERLHETGADSVQSYSPVGKHHPYWMIRLDDAGRVRQHVENSVHRRQDLPPLFIPDGGVIAVRREALMDPAGEASGHPHAFFGSDRRGIISQGPVVDIDDAIDLAVAEALLQASTSTTSQAAGSPEPDVAALGARA